MLRNISAADLRALKVFQTVSACGGFSAAETALGLTQPTISAQINNLEIRLGFKLCKRGRSGFKLTDRGRILLHRYSILADELQLFCQETSALSQHLVGEISLGLNDNIIHTEANIIPDILRRFQSRDQDVHVKITVSGAKRLEAGLLNKSIDLAIGMFPISLPAFNYMTLCEERQAVFCGKEHHLYGVPEQSINEADLRKVDWVDTGYETDIKQRGLLESPFSTVFASNQEAVAQLILSGGFLGYLPTEYGRIWVEKKEMWEIPRPELSYNATLSAVYPQRNKGGPIISAFLADIIAVLEK